MKKEKPTIAFIIGTRAELIKTFPVMQELQKQKTPYLFIHTGQHNLGKICDIFKVKRPDVVLTEEPQKGSRFNGKQGKAIIWNLQIVRKIKKELKKYPELKYVIYHGDTQSTASAAIATSKILSPMKKYQNVHLESGLRSWNNKEPFPEEIARQIAIKMSDILLAPSEQAKENIKHHKKKKMYNIGNTILDSANHALKIAKLNGTKPLTTKPFAIINIHRHENIKNKERLEKIIKIIQGLPIPAYFAMHDNTKEQLIKYNLMKKLENIPNIKMLPAMNYPDFIYQVSKSKLIICDGGSIQEESLIFHKPCIILRKATERPEGLQSNFQYLSKLDVAKTIKKVKEYTGKKFTPEEFENPYGREGVAKKVVKILKQ